mgnify:CR=1 FL=1
MASRVPRRPRPATDGAGALDAIVSRRLLALNRGVCAYRSNFSTDPEKTLASAFAILLQREGFRVGDKVVVISDILEGAGVEAIHVREVPALSAVADVADFPDEDQDAP